MHVVCLQGDRGVAFKSVEIRKKKEGKGKRGHASAENQGRSLDLEERGRGMRGPGAGQEGRGRLHTCRNPKKRKCQALGRCCGRDAGVRGGWGDGNCRIRRETQASMLGPRPPEKNDSCGFMWKENNKKGSKYGMRAPVTLWHCLLACFQCGMMPRSGAGARVTGVPSCGGCTAWSNLRILLNDAPADHKRRPSFLGKKEHLLVLGEGPGRVRVHAS